MIDYFAFVCVFLKAGIHDSSLVYLSEFLTYKKTQTNVKERLFASLQQYTIGYYSVRNVKMQFDEVF